ncbi:MAG: prolipoprotein diacylglyceryl transferase, partial [Nocardia sp.]|nr:prolipoprotein diacylglyceryl transferase [Nocardia sp.]
MHGASVLAYIPSPPRGVWDVGPLPLRAYAICIIIGIVVAIWLGERRWQARGGQSGTVLDVAMFAVPFGLVGGRLYHVATDWQKYFGAGGHPINALKIWEGGLGIWGAVALGAVGAWIACRIYRIPLPAFGDAIAPGILFAQAIGRLGNYFNQELYGRQTTKPWGLQIYLRFDSNGQLDMMNGVSTGVVEKVVQPTFLYELIWNLFGVAVLFVVDRRWRIGHGRLFALYVAIYTFGRFWVELLRDDEATHIFGLRVNTYTSTIVFLCAIAYFVIATRGREVADRLLPGAERPWPWQWGALRRLGKEQAAEQDSLEGGYVDAESLAGEPEPEYVGDSEVWPDESDEEPQLEDEAPEQDVAGTGAAESAAAESGEADSESGESASGDDESDDGDDESDHHGS